MVKTCSTCKTLKSSDEFNKNSRKSDGLQASCKVCSRATSRLYYRNNTVEHRKAVAANSKLRRIAAQEKIYEYLLTHACVDCQEADPVVLEFDHIRGDKINHVTQMLVQDAAFSRIEAEIAKCEVVCANCHRRRTASRGNWYRWRLQQEELQGSK